MVKLSLGTYSTELEWDGGEPPPAFAKAQEIVFKQPVTHDLWSWCAGFASLGFLYTLIGIVVMIGVKKAVPEWLWIALVAFLATAHIAIPLSSMYRRKIRLEPGWALTAFWRKNRDELLKLVIAGILGGLITALFRAAFGK